MKYWNSSAKNIGDAITPFILKKLDIQASFSTYPDILCIGSILGFKDIEKMTNIAIWGSGYLNEADVVFNSVKNANILAVRGKLTAQKLNKSNIMLGDPGLLISKVYKPQTTAKKYKYGIICHCTDYDQISKDAKIANIQYPIINAQFNKIVEESDIQNFVNLINSCECIISSSLHGIIFAHAYGIPAIYLKNENNKCKNDSHVISQNDFKFKDYYSSIDLPFKFITYDNKFNFISNLTYTLPNRNIIIDMQNNLISVLKNYAKPKQITTNKKAFVAFISSDNYIYYILHLYKNLLDVNSKYPLYCGVTESVSTNTVNILKKVGINVFKLNAQDIANSTILQNSVHKGMCQSYINAFTKLAILRETKFEKIVYLDTDLWIKENIDELMGMPHMSAVEDLAPYQNHTIYKEGCSIFCSGLFVWDFKNYPTDGKNILNLLNNLNPNLQWHDQNVLNYYYNNWINQPKLHLSPKYGVMACNGPLNMVESPKIIHYVVTIKSKIPFKGYTFKFNEFLYNYVYAYFKSINDTILLFNNKYNLNIEPIQLSSIINKDTLVKNEQQAYGKSGYYLAF